MYNSTNVLHPVKTAKFTVTTYEKTELELPLPYYCKSDSTFLPDYFAVINETTAYRVTNCETYTNIVKSDPSSYLSDIKKATKISREEFLLAMSCAIDTLSKSAA